MSDDSKPKSHGFHFDMEDDDYLMYDNLVCCLTDAKCHRTSYTTHHHPRKLPLEQWMIDWVEEKMREDGQSEEAISQRVKELNEKMEKENGSDQ